jgi:hypothetical protein
MKHIFMLLAAMGVACTLIAQPKTAGKEIGTTPVPAISQGDHSPLELFAEGFNDTSATGFPPSGWIMINRDGNISTTGDTAWYQSLSVGGVGGPGPYEGLAFAADYYGSANGFYIDDYLITPNTGSSAPPGSVDSLTFWLTSRLSSSGNYPDSLDIRVSTTGRNADDFTLRLGYVLAPKAQWTRFAYALPIAPVRYIAFRYLIYDGGPTGTNSDKICLDDVRITRYPSMAVPIGSDIPGGYALKQNYPNPFNPTTRIPFSISSPGLTTLTVYDMLGKEVKTLVREVLPAGNYETTFDATGLPSGVYHYRLRSASFVATKSLLIIK